MAAARVSFSLWASMALARPPALGNSHTGFVRKAAAWCSAPQIRFAPPRSSNWKSGRSATASRSSNRNPAPILQLSFTMRLRCAKARAADVVIVDTAGRLHTKSNLMAELDKMKRTAAKVIPGSPHDVLLVLDATTGQNALALARKGLGLASPNPMVGCVIVREGQIVGEGFHQYEWRDHAEIVALKSAGEKARGATLYVTLEPCNHTGRTGPCTEAIIAAGIRRVVAAMDDPNPVNFGRGFERLRAAGIEVFTGVCKEEARRLNEPFTCWIRTKKPFVTLKSALTLDGQLALPKHAKKSGKRANRDWISSEESRAEVHRMRHASDALLD